MTNNVIECNGFKAFHGNLIVYDPETGECMLKFCDVDCVYNPKTNCWNVDDVNDYQFDNSVVEIIPYDLTIGGKCKSASNVSILGIQFDSCEYEVVEEHYECKVEILRCRNCGHEEVSWFRSSNDDN